MTFPYPPDDPAEVAAIAASLRIAAVPPAEAVDELRRRAIRRRPPWRSRGGDAAATEVRRLTALCAEGATGLRSAALAMGRYRDALTQARSGVDRLNEQYGAAFAHRQRAAPDEHGAQEWARELAGFERGHGGVLADLDTVSRQTVQALRDSLKPIGGSANEAAMIRALARRLPLWEKQAATGMAESAARALDPRHPMKPVDRAALMRKYAAWQDDPVFATTLAQRLGPAKFREMLTAAVPWIYGPKLAPTLNAYYGFLGHVLGTARLSKKWLAEFVDNLGSMDNQRLQVGLGLALRHGTYRARTIETIAPPMYSARADHGLDTRLPFGDPLVGVMDALASNPAAAAEFLHQEQDRLATLLARVWREDDGRALGALLAATSMLHTDISAVIAETTVHWVAGHIDSTPSGLSAGLGEMLGNYVDDVNHGLINLSSDAPVVENALPVVSPGPHAHFSQADLMRAIYVVMQSSQGSVALYSHQAIYSAQQLEKQVDSSGPSTVLSELAVNYGRLSKIHELALTKSATLANESEAERLKNSTSWISLASIAVGVLPIPRISGLAGLAAGFGKGRAIDYFAEKLQQKYYEKPLARDSAKRFDEADKLAIEEEKATKKYVATLTKRLGGDTSNTWISSQSLAAGRDDAEYVLGHIS